MFCFRFDQTGSVVTVRGCYFKTKMDDNFQKSFLDINSATDDYLVGRVPGWITELISRNSVELFSFLASMIVACKPTNKEHGYRDTAIKFANS